MATLAWNINLLGGITKDDFEAWRVAAKIPPVYNFNVIEGNKVPDYWDNSNITQTFPEVDNTIIITGYEAGVDFDPYCYAGNRCTMMAEKNDAFATGTEVFALMLTCDGLLSADTLNKLMDNVDFGAWVKNNFPERYPIYNNRTALIGSNGYIDEDNPDGEKLKNTICQYVVKVLGLGSQVPVAIPTETPFQTPTTPTNPAMPSIPPTIAGMPTLYVAAGGAVALTLLGYYLYQKGNTP
jgi:hypothetical protein